MWCVAWGYFVGITDKINGIRRALNRFQTGAATILLIFHHHHSYSIERKWCSVVQLRTYTLIRLFGVSTEFQHKTRTMSHNMHLVNFVICTSSPVCSYSTPCMHRTNERTNERSANGINSQTHKTHTYCQHTHTFGWIRWQTWACMQKR